MSIQTTKNAGTDAMRKTTKNTQPSTDILDSYYQALEDVISGKPVSSARLVMGNTPAVLQMIGLPNLPMYIHRKTVLKDALRKHNMTVDDLKALPLQLSAPVAIMKSQRSSSNPDAYLILTTLIERDDKQDKPVIAAIYIEKHSDMLEVKSVYGRRYSQLERDLQNTLYFDNEKGQLITDNFGYQLSPSLSTADPYTHIKTKQDLSQYLLDKNTAATMSKTTTPPKTSKSTKKSASLTAKSQKPKAADKLSLAKTAQTPPSRPMNVDKRLAFFKKLAAHITEPVTELNYSSDFELLIAVMLSAQATDKSVNIATDKLFAIANTPQAILDLGLDGLKSYINSIGLYNSKAANVIKTCQDLITKHDGEVPRTRHELESLAGVGRKTANVVLNTAFGQPVMAVDTHIFRISNRTGLATGKTVLAVEKALMKRIHTEYLVDAHHYLILHGRYTCMARSPKCGACVVYDECMFKDKAKWADLD